MLKRQTWLLPVAALSLLVAAAPLAAIAPAALAATASIAVATNATLGNILTDGNGMTLYVFKNDTTGKSTCSGSCAQTWPAFVVDDETQMPTLPSGVTGKVEVIDRPDGKYQVTFNGMPLYLYSGDAKAGDTNGQGIGGVWSVLSTNPPANSSSSGSSQNNYSAPSGNSYSSGNSTYGNSYGGYGNYGSYGYGSYSYGGYGSYAYPRAYAYSYVMPYRPYIVPHYRVFPRFRYFPSMIRRPFFFGRMGMGMMRRY
jgi:predicted lipoprotein with Yx(FWY)xxD motif